MASDIVPNSMDDNYLAKKIATSPLLVLAGGFGTRLASLNLGVPKPLVPIGEVPFLEILLESWVRQGARKFVFLLHHQASLIKTFLQEIELKHTQVEIITIVEETPLGTGGAVANAVYQLELTQNLIIVNADTWLSGGLNTMATAKPNSIGLIELTSDSSRYGNVDLQNGQIISFNEKKRKPSSIINAGLYNLKATNFKIWDGNAFSLEQHLFPLLVRNRELAGEMLNVEFCDIGVPSDYEKFVNMNCQGLY